jgi:hypothetical protein
LFQAVAVAVHFEDMDMMCEAIQESAGQACLQNGHLSESRRAKWAYEATALHP